jgi:hypothetical protein
MAWRAKVERHRSRDERADFLMSPDADPSPRQAAMRIGRNAGGNRLHAASLIYKNNSNHAVAALV